ncbi:MAG TPA: hypothetical protein VFR32_11125 [Gaiellaceae bacterium]|nr:hypothetical protein [Gaiellaceae bacterium]
MRGAIAIGAGFIAAAMLAALAGASSSSDIYITGSVMQRVAGENASVVRIAWDYKCLGEDRGSYEWTLKVVRQSPLPLKTTTLGDGTSERGEKLIQLTPGRYLPKSDPYFCETERGQGYDKPEIGGAFVVPDYCVWNVSSARGAVQLEHQTAVKLAKPGSTVSPGDALVTPKSGRVALASAARDGTARLVGSSRLELDGKHCAGTSGWKLRLERGSATAAVPKAAAKRSFLLVTANASVTGAPGASWTTSFAPGLTKVQALAGKVRVAGKSGAALVLKAGKSATVKGSAPPR